MGGMYTELVPVVSSNISGVGWTPTFRGVQFSWLEVEFLSGSLYGYTYVTESMYNAFLDAPSKGKYFWKNIRCKTIDCSGGDIPYSYYRLR